MHYAKPTIYHLYMIMYFKDFQTSSHVYHTIKLKQHVMNPLSKFQLNRTVNKLENAVLRKLHKLEKSVAPNA